MKVGFPMVFVSDMKSSTAFYRDVLGLPLKFETPHWTEFGTEETVLALHVSENANAEPDDPSNMPAGRCRMGFSVPDLDAFHQRMVEHEVRCVQEPKDVFGARVAQYADPDGLAFSVGEERGKA